MIKKEYISPKIENNGTIIYAMPLAAAAAMIAGYSAAKALMDDIMQSKTKANKEIKDIL